MALRRKHIAFIEAYTTKGAKSYLNATESARSITPGSRNPSSRGHQLLKIPQIAKEVDRRLEADKQNFLSLSNINREEFVSINRQCFEELPASHPNKPRFSEIIAKTMGFYSDGTNIGVMVQHNENEPPLKSRVQNLYRKVKSPKPQSADT